MAEDFTLRNEEWDIDGVLLCADLEITFNWTWFEGEPGDFTVMNVRLFYGPVSRKAPRYAFDALADWTALNQAKILQRYHDAKIYQDALA